MNIVAINAMSALLLLFLADAAVAASPQVQLAVHVGELGDGTLDKPALTWSDGQLEVSAITDMTATTEVESTAPGITVTDGTLSLCYHQKVTPRAPGQMTPMWARPVLLEFTVKGLPKQDYKVSVAVCP